MNKDGAAPSFASHRDETAVRFNQTIEIMRLRHGQKRAIEPITPRMIRADEAHRLNLRLIQNGRRAMATNIMKRPNDVVPAATDDDGNTTSPEPHGCAGLGPHAAQAGSQARKRRGEGQGASERVDF